MSTEEIGRGGGKQTARVARTMESGANSLTHVHPILPRCIMEVARLPGKSKLQVWANQKHTHVTVRVTIIIETFMSLELCSSDLTIQLQV